MTRKYLSHLYKSANKHTKLHNGTHRKFAFALTGYTLSLMRGFVHFRPTPSTDKGSEGSAYTPPPVPSQPSGGNEFWELLPF